MWISFVLLGTRGTMDNVQKSQPYYPSLSLPLYRGPNGAEDQVLLDIHFKHPTVVLYRTDVVFGWLDLTGMYTYTR
jgi:hypothetical protein